MAQKPNNKHNKGQRVVRINFSTILYVILLASIGWMLLNNSSAPASKIEWAQVQEMAREGKNYEEILMFFYDGVEIRDCEED